MWSFVDWLFFIHDEFWLLESALLSSIVPMIRFSSWQQSWRQRSIYYLTFSSIKKCSERKSSVMVQGALSPYVVWIFRTCQFIFVLLILIIIIAHNSLSSCVTPQHTVYSLSYFASYVHFFRYDHSTIHCFGLPRWQFFEWH